MERHKKKNPKNVGRIDELQMTRSNSKSQPLHRDDAFFKKKKMIYRFLLKSLLFIDATVGFLIGSTAKTDASKTPHGASFIKNPLLLTKMEAAPVFIF